jgi:hypothetical protein
VSGWRSRRARRRRRMTWRQRRGGVRAWRNGWWDRRRKKRALLMWPPPASGSEFPYKSDQTLGFDARSGHPWAGGAITSRFEIRSHAASARTGFLKRSKLCCRISWSKPYIPLLALRNGIGISISHTITKEISD